MRTQVAPRLLPLALRLPWVRRQLFRTVSQTGIAYPDSPLSQGHPPGGTSGMRLPWAPGRYEALRPAGWHVLCAGPPPVGLAHWTQTHGLPLTEVAPAPAEAPGTVYLVRPDGYVGLVMAAFQEAELTAYAGTLRLMNASLNEE